MKYTYHFVNGETSEIEVANGDAFILMDFDRRERNNNQTESRRHVHYDPAMEDASDWLTINDPALDAVTEGETDEMWLRRAITTLLPEQQALVKQVFVKGRSYADIAREEGVDRSAVRKRIDRIITSLKKFSSRPSPSPIFVSDK